MGPIKSSSLRASKVGAGTVLELGRLLGGNAFRSRSTFVPIAVMFSNLTVDFNVREGEFAIGSRFTYLGGSRFKELGLEGTEGQFLFGVMVRVESGDVH